MFSQKNSFEAVLANKFTQKEILKYTSLALDFFGDFILNKLSHKTLFFGKF